MSAIAEKKSTHRVEIVPIVLEPHPNADSLSIVRVFGYTVCARTEDWKDRKLGAYIVPDSMVDTTRPEFDWLADGKKQFHRVRVKKLRGICSMGLLVPAPEGSKEGDDVSELLGVTRYEAPEVADTGGQAENPPSGHYPHYDLDAFLRYGRDVFTEGEPVFVTEKIDGSNARYVFTEGRIWCGSRNQWKAESESSVWWRALANTPSLRTFCEQHPDLVVYGEVYGNNSKMPYTRNAKQIRFAAFDILDRKSGRWLDAQEAYDLATAAGVPWVPVLNKETPFSFDKMVFLAEGPSLVEGAPHIREGVVVKPIKERWHAAVGRVCLKVVSTEYLETK